MKRISLFLIISLVTVFSQGQKLPSFAAGDKVCFIGNSITQDGRYHMLFQSYYATRFPGVEVEFYNCGIAGDVATGMINRFESDIWIHKPTKAFLMTGMNDVMQYLYEPSAIVDSLNLARREQALQAYINNTETLASMLKNKGVETIFITPSIYDQTSKISQSNNFGVNDALKQYSAHIKQLAKKHNATVVDFNNMMETINLKGQQNDSLFTIVGHDRVHPGDVGHFIMAYELIKTVLPQQALSKIVIDGKKGRIQANNNATVECKKTRKEISLNVKNVSLPFPIFKQYSQALNWIPFLDELNQELLTISNLKQGNYTLDIDGIYIGTFSSDELKNGINLATNENTPQYKQASKVLKLCTQYHKTMGKLRTLAFIDYRMLNEYTGPNTAKRKQSYLQAKLDADIGKSWHAWNTKNVNRYFELLPQKEALINEVNELRNQIYKSNLPLKHNYVIKAQ
ncbi:SGNH/GDSL hydrolase family protein [Saccharicrinis aurantiacus]|uniref:SGNH/GDSL hydrolase family protein n=1 Tax=Saccharicrinis aurantiacus TaxID=1849719 RepID=UPI00249246B4|nr:SGNH/GDSL hydrolase family protein [Saccharicrinis aurantiacus]